jgi:hypothetical protein
MAPPPTQAIFRLPVEIGQAALFADSGKDVRYSFSASALPGLAYGVLDVGALVSGIYRNPAPDCFTCTVDLGTGARVSLAVWSTLEEAVDVRLAVEGEYLWRGQNGRGAAGVLGDLSSLLRLGFWGGRDWAADAYFFSFTLGVDLMAFKDPIGELLRLGPMEDPDHVGR